MKDQISAINRRLERLEQVVFGDKTADLAQKRKLVGVKGGCLLLLSKGFFAEKRSAPDTQRELESNRFHYRISVVQTALNRLTGPKGPLVSLSIKGGKVYVERR